MQHTDNDREYFTSDMRADNDGTSSGAINVQSRDLETDDDQSCLITRVEGRPRRSGVCGAGDNTIQMCARKI